MDCAMRSIPGAPEPLQADPVARLGTRQRKAAWNASSRCAVRALYGIDHRRDGRTPSKLDGSPPSRRDGVTISSELAPIPHRGAEDRNMFKRLIAIAAAAILCGASASVLAQSHGGGHGGGMGGGGGGWHGGGGGWQGGSGGSWHGGG